MSYNQNALLKCFDILQAKKDFADGKNVTEQLRAQKNLDANTSEIIEVAYDLQAGTYIQAVEQNAPFVTRYVDELSDIIYNYIAPTDTLLDVGTGEITILSLLLNQLSTQFRHVFAFDISWSRVYKGIEYAKTHMGECFNRFTPFVADIVEIPMLDKSVNVTISNHALEPNGSRLFELLSELYRVTKDKLILFEPCYEINTQEGKKRMERLGYIKGMDNAVEQLGGVLLEKIMIKNVLNPLNPTVCFIIQPPPKKTEQMSLASPTSIFSVPGTNYQLMKIDDFFYSDITGLCFPTLKSIPILKSKVAILASALSNR